MRKILSLLIIISVLAIGIFGFTTMNHGASHTVRCIASAVDNTLCPDNTTVMSVRHIQAFVAFFSVIPSIPFVFLSTLLFVVFLSIRFLFTKQSNFLVNQVLWQTQYNPEHQLAHPQKITRWLSLFENSPSLHRIFITNSNLMNLCTQKISNTIKFTTYLIQMWHSIWSAEWSLMWIILRQAPITKIKPTTSVLFTARITLQPIQLSM